MKKKPLDFYKLRDDSNTRHYFEDRIEALKTIKTIRRVFAIGQGLNPDCEQITKETELSVKKILNAFNSNAEATIPESIMITFGLRKEGREQKEDKIKFLKLLLEELQSEMLP